MNNASVPFYNSGYLAHLHELAKEAKARFAGVPPFRLVFGAALFSHIAILAPIYVLNLAEDIPEITQVQVSFGIDHMRDVKEKIQDAKTVDDAINKSPQRNVTVPDISSNIDALLQPKTQATKTPVPKAATSFQPTRINNNATPSNAASSLNRRSRQQEQFVRPVSRNATAGGRAGVSESQMRDAITKYERLLSGWIDRHKIYPDAAYRNNIEGQVILRLRIDRRGGVIFKAIDRSSGKDLLDKAVLDTVSRASPMPVVPSEYPGAEQLEFLIPIQFSVD